MMQKKVQMMLALLVDQLFTLSVVRVYINRLESREIMISINTEKYHKNKK